MEEHNKTLALLLVAAIVVSLGGTIVSLNKLGQFEISSVTGQVTQGTATINVSSTSTINLTDTSIDFGTGALTTGVQNCTMYSNGTYPTTGMEPDTCGTWDWGVADYIVIQNVGSLDVTVELGSDVAAAAFIGGTSPAAGYMCYDPSDCCSGALQDTWLDFTGAGGQPCAIGLDTTDNEVYMYAYVRVGTETSGQKTATLTFAIA